MVKKVVNYFSKLLTDVEERSQDNSTYEFLLNGHPFRYDGRGGVVTLFKGMEVKFSFPDGFIPIGYTTYNGVMYFALLDEQAQQIEFGSYPSPDYDTCTGGWKGEYAPFRNYTDDINYNLEDFYDECGQEVLQVPTLPFRTDREYFGWTCSHRLDVFARESYDGGVMLYFADGENPNIVVPAGFHHQTGVCLPRYVSLFDLQSGTIVQYNESAALATFNLVAVETNGVLKAGHYLFFLRYNNQNGSATSFVASSGPVMIAGSPQTGGTGQPDTFGGEYSEQTGKSVRLAINNLDTAYQRFEIGYIYFSGGFSESYLIEGDYYIQGLPDKEIVITGREIASLINAQEFLSLKPLEKSCLTHTEANNIYYGANWTGRRLHHPDLCQYAACVVIGEQKVVLGKSVMDFFAPPLNQQWNGFNTENQVYYDVGYFSGETYVFLLHPVFKTGEIGLGYPMYGGDNFTGSIPAPTENSKGIYRFSSPAADGFLSLNGTDILYSKKVTFDFSACVPSQWIEDNVQSWIISRAERKANLLYQGLAAPVYDGQVIIEDDFYHSGWQADEEDLSREKHAPLINGLDFWMYRKGGSDPEQITRIYYGINGSIDLPDSNRQPESLKTGKYGVFSVDWMLDQAAGVQMPSSGFMVRWATESMDAGDSFTENGSRDSVIFNNSIAGWQRAWWPFPTGGLRGAVKLYGIAPWDYSPNNGFVSRVDSGQEPVGSGWWRAKKSQAGRDDIILNMPMAWPAYIGVDGWEAADVAHDLVGIYSSDPFTLDILNVYDPPNELFYPITQPIPVGFAGVHVEGRGDCFTQRTYIKTLHAHTTWTSEFLSFITETHSVGDTIEKGYGILLSIVTENKYNHAMRLLRSGNGFYPATSLENNGEFIYRYDSPESNFSNDGYQRTLSPRVVRAFDPQAFYGQERYPTRIRYSDPNLVAGVQDTYRNSGTSQAEDYDLQFGPIFRIMEYMNRLYSAQWRRLNLHPIQERLLQETSEGDQVTTGVVQSLPQYVQPLSDGYGLQHTFAMIKGVNGLYGLDADKRIFWRIQENQAVDLGLVKGCSLKIHEMLEKGGDKTSDITMRLPDNPLCGEGIHAGYNFDHKEVVMTVLKMTGLETWDNSTLCFSESLDEFTHEHSTYPRIYFTLNKDFFSYIPEIGQDVWLHECTEEYNNFYGEQHPFVIRFTVRDSAEIEKLFHANQINALHYSLHETRWWTDHQQAFLDWLTAPFWRQPKYRNNKWRLSIQRSSSDNIPAGIYQPGSPLTGRWLTMEITYRGDENIRLRDVVTDLTEAKH